MPYFFKEANNQVHIFHSNESWQIFLRSNRILRSLCTQTQIFHQTGKNILTEKEFKFYMALSVKKEQITSYLSIPLEPPRLHPICTNAAPKECFWPKKFLNFMHGFKSAILAKIKNCHYKVGQVNIGVLIFTLLS